MIPSWISKEMRTSRCLSSSPKIQVQLPARSPTAVDEEEFQKIKNIATKASGKQDIAIRFIGNVKGEAGFDVYVLVELDEQEDLGGIKFDTTAFVSHGNLRGRPADPILII